MWEKWFLLLNLGRCWRISFKLQRGEKCIQYKIHLGFVFLFFPPLSQIHQLLSLLPKWYYTIRARGKSRGSSGFLTLLFLSVWFTHLPLCCLSWNKALIKAGAEMRGRKVWFESLSACIHSTPMSFWDIVSRYTALWFCPPDIKLYVHRGRL